MQRLTLCAAPLLFVLALPARAEVGPRAARVEIEVDWRDFEVADSYSPLSCAYYGRVCTQTSSAEGYDGAPSLACALDRAGGVRCWSVVEGLAGARVEYARLPEQPGPAIDLAVTRTQLCVLLEGGAVSCQHYAWDELGRSWLFAPAPRVGGSFRSITGGGAGWCGVTTDGGLACRDTGARCENLAESTPRARRPIELSCTSPVELQEMPLPAPATAVSLGLDGGCAIDATARLHCWGAHALPQASPTPVPITQLSGVEAVSVDYAQSCALARGKVWCWPAAGSATSGPRELRRVDVADGARALWSVLGQVCWLDDASALRCQSHAVSVEEPIEEARLGRQWCLGGEPDALTCLAEPFALGPVEGLPTAAWFVLAGGGGGFGDVGGARAGLAEARLRAGVTFGPSGGGRGAQRWGLGPLLDARWRAFEEAELGAGVRAHWTGESGLRFVVDGTTGLAGDELFASAGVALHFVSHLARFPYPYEPWVNDFAIGPYVTLRRGFESGAVDLTAGVEVELVALGRAVIGELAR